MLNFLEKRRETKKQKDAFKFIKQNLSEKFTIITVKDIRNIPELSDMILYSKLCVIKARIDETDSIHLKIESVNGSLYEGFTQNYSWFLETFSFEED